MKVFLRPTGLYSHAMLRVAMALKYYAPPHVEVVNENPNDADLRVIHAIGEGLFEGVDQNQPHVIIQYCIKSAGFDSLRWSLIWQRAQMVWSYYDLTDRGGGTLFDFYHAPLGVDPTFAYALVNGRKRDIAVMSSGFSTVKSAEPIEEVAWAAEEAKANHLHLGPEKIEGMTAYPKKWKTVLGITDQSLRDFYLRTEWVAAMRYIEGFELPALEGLMCGARPIVFDRPDMRQWYEGHAVFVPELEGPELKAELIELLRHRPAPVTETERQKVFDTFNWKRIATGFWERLL